MMLTRSRTHGRGGFPRVLAIVATMLLVLPVEPHPAAAADRPVDLVAAVAERATYGLAAEADLVADIVNSGRDIGTGKWGIVLTADEEAALNLPRRMAFANAVSEELLPHAGELATFGGAYIDQERHGELVIGLTQRDGEVEASLRALLPDDAIGLRFERVERSYAELRAAADVAEAAWRTIMGERLLPGYAPDVRLNTLRFDVRPVDMEAASAALADLEAAAGVPIVLRPAEIGGGDACSWASCFSPMLAGIKVYRGGYPSYQVRCTMGFHINVGSDEQWTTSGHCTNAGSNAWYMQGYGKIGDETATIYWGGGYDITRIQMSDAQDSDGIYATSHNVSGSRMPINGETVCAALGGTSETIDCGTISDDWKSYFMFECWCNVNGGDTSGISTQGGDSGSPIYVPGQGFEIAIGVHSDANGHFARIQDALVHWNATIRS